MNNYLNKLFYTSGFVGEALGWRAIFWALSALAVVLAAAVALLLPETLNSTGPKRSANPLQTLQFLIYPPITIIVSIYYHYLKTINVSATDSLTYYFINDKGLSGWAHVWSHVYASFCLSCMYSYLFSFPLLTKPTLSLFCHSQLFRLR